MTEQQVQRSWGSSTQSLKAQKTTQQCSWGRRQMAGGVRKVRARPQGEFGDEKGQGLAPSFSRLFWEGVLLYSPVYNMTVLPQPPE